MLKQFEHYEFSDSVPANVRRILAGLETVFSPDEVERAVDQMAVRMTVALQNVDPIVITVLHGGSVVAGMLQRRLVFPCQFGYVHVNSYGDGTAPGPLQWHGVDVPDLSGRTVVFVDDILDMGQTLGELVYWAQNQGAVQVLRAVLVQREQGREANRAEFTGFVVGDGFLLGCGMDYAGYGRNLPGIYRLSAQEEESR